MDRNPRRVEQLLAGQRVPPALTTAIERWRARPDGVPLRGGMSVVAPVVLPDGRRAMAKALDPVAAEREAAGLRAFPVASSVQLYDHDRSSGVLLLERLDGPALDRHPDADESVRIQARLAAELTVADPGGLPRLADVAGWLDQLDDQVRQAPAVLDARTVGAARESIMALGTETWATLTHGDLHGANVLRDASGIWRAIDPTPWVGPVAHECHTVVRDDLARLADSGRALLDRRIAIFAEVSGADLDACRRLCQARAVSSALHEHLVGAEAVAGRLAWMAAALTPTSQQPTDTPTKGVH